MTFPVDPSLSQQLESLSCRMERLYATTGGRCGCGAWLFRLFCACTFILLHKEPGRGRGGGGGGGLSGRSTGIRSHIHIDQMLIHSQWAPKTRSLPLKQSAVRPAGSCELGDQIYCGLTSLHVPTDEFSSLTKWQTDLSTNRNVLRVR